jgi:hypothetical protein
MKRHDAEHPGLDRDGRERRYDGTASIVRLLDRLKTS